MRCLLCVVLFVVTANLQADDSPVRSSAKADITFFLPAAPAVEGQPYELVVELHNEGTRPIELTEPVGVTGAKTFEDPESKRAAATGDRLTVLYYTARGAPPRKYHSGLRPRTTLLIGPQESKLLKIEIPSGCFVSGECGVRAVLERSGATLARSDRVKVICEKPREGAAPTTSGNP